MKLLIEKVNLNDERQACTAILNYLEGTVLKNVEAKKEEKLDTADKIIEILLVALSQSEKASGQDEV